MPPNSVTNTLRKFFTTLVPIVPLCHLFAENKCMYFLLSQTLCIVSYNVHVLTNLSVESLNSTISVKQFIHYVESYHTNRLNIKTAWNNNCITLIFNYLCIICYDNNHGMLYFSYNRNIFWTNEKSLSSISLVLDLVLWQLIDCLWIPYFHCLTILNGHS